MANATTPVIQINEGNVGIGTTTPLAKLDIQGTQGQLFSVTDNLSGSIFAVSDISGVPIFDVNSSGLSTFDGDVDIKTSFGGSNFYQLGVGTTSSGSIYTEGRIFCGGTSFTDGEAIFNDKVGIGVTSPATKLEVRGGSGTGEHAHATFTGTANRGLKISTTNLPYGQNSGTVIYNAQDTEGYSEHHWQLGGTTKMVLNKDGNVGIGATTPASKLNVASTGANAYSATLDSASNMKGIKNVVTSNTDDMVGIYFATGTTTTGTHWSGITGSRSDNASHWGTQLNFYTHNNDVAQLNHATQKMVIKGDGNVGIGVTVPLVKLHVNQGNVSGTVIKASGIQAQIEIQTSTAGNAHLYMRPNTTGDNAAIFKMTAGTNYNWRWQDDATTPVVFMQLSQSNSSLSVKGDIIAYGAPSDKRYKENIKPIESALDKAVKLQGVTFDWKETDSILDIKEDIGFIAQDVQKVVPELVRENEDGKLSLRYQGVTPILLEAIKELKAEIDLLKSKPCNCNNCNCSI